MRARQRLLGVALVAALAAGCTHQFGPAAVPSARIDYNEAISRSWDEQMLLNLVRLRYRDNPQFLEVSGVTTQFSYDAAAGVGADFDLGAGGDAAGGSFGVGYSETPTVSYSPLQGEAFARRVLAPLEPRMLTLLSQSGWSIERLMLCCVHQINHLRNAPSAAGPTPDYVPPHYEEFQEVSALLRELQVAGWIQVAVRRVEGEGEQKVVVAFDPLDPAAPDNRAHQAKLARFRELLAISGDGAQFEITDMVFDRGDDQVALRGRSLMGTLFFLSQSVDVPPSDEEAGLVTVTRYPDGRRFDWNELSGKLLRVHTAPAEPADAFVRVRYRGHWFYIADSDLNSKTTFGLLKYLFSLQSEPSKAAPLLTLSAGG